MKKFLAVLLVISLAVMLVGCCYIQEPINRNEAGAQAGNTIIHETPDDSTNQDSTESDTSSDNVVNSRFTNITDPRDLIEIWDQYRNMNFCCDSIYVDDSSMFGNLTEDQKQWAAGIKKSTCCCTIEEAKEHMAHYFDSSLLNNIHEDHFLEYNGELYIVLGAKGHMSHDYPNMKVQELSNGDVIITADSLGSGGNFCGVDEFTIKKVNDTYVIYSVKELS